MSAPWKGDLVADLTRTTLERGEAGISLVDDERRPWFVVLPDERGMFDHVVGFASAMNDLHEMRNSVRALNQEQDAAKGAFAALKDALVGMLRAFGPGKTSDQVAAYSFARAVAGEHPIRDLDGTKPLILYFASEVERSDFVDVFQSVKPGVRTVRL